MSFTKTIPDRPARDLVRDDTLAVEAAACTFEVAQFVAADRMFRILMLRRTNLDTDLDTNDRNAKNLGFTVLNTLVAVDEEIRVFAAWDFYSTGDVAPFKSKGMEVDANTQKCGIGKAFWQAMQKEGYDIAPSGEVTAAGARLLNSLGCSRG